MKARAKVDAAMDWHHGNTRFGAAGLTFQKVLAPQRGIPVQPAVVKAVETALRNALQVCLAVEKLLAFVIVGLSAGPGASIMYRHTLSGSDRSGGFVGWFASIMVGERVPARVDRDLPRDIE